MAMTVKPQFIGVDVSKDHLDICIDQETTSTRIANQPRDINRWLKSLTAGPACLALEATSTYHLELAVRAYKAGLTVYLIDGYRLNRYRDSIGQRAKTDAADAQLILRYLQREQDSLKPWTPPAKAYLRLQSLLRRRALLVKSKTAIRQSFRLLPELRRSGKALVKKIENLDRQIVRQILKTLTEAGWQPDFQRCRAIEGFGEVISAAMTMAFHRGPFKSSDAFVAFLGLDVRVRDSGTRRGKRKLTKKGDPELRRLLYLAAMNAIKYGQWKVLYQRYLDRGFKKTQALIIIARKLARLAFALMKNQDEYRPASA